MSKMNDQIDIRLINLENKFLKRFESFSEFREQTLIRLNNEEEKVLKITDDIYALNLWKKEAIARFDQGIENRTKAFERIEVLEKQVSILKNLLDQYFTLEIDQIKESHAKRKV